MQCPDCTGTLKEKVELGIHLDECSGCYGIWFDFGELDTYRQALTGLSQAPKTKFVVDSDQPKSTCPRCRQRELVIGDVGQFALRKCNNCSGVFVPAHTIANFKPSTTGQAVGDAALEAVVHGDLDVVGDLLSWIIEAVFDGL